MNQPYPLTTDTKEYLTRFYQIFDTMKTEMTEAALDESISHNFIVQMIPHHRAAIRMSCNLLEYSAWEPLRSVASRIVSEQTNGIERMEAILSSGALPCNSAQELGLYQRKMNQILDTMFAGMDGACFSNDINADFMREMLPHHQGAVEMSCNALRFPIVPALLPILNEIISSQEKGIRQMERLLRTCGQ